MTAGREVKLYDSNRTPRHWHELMEPTQCAVFMKHGETTVPLGPNGTRVDDPNESTCMIFDRLQDARSFCESKVQEFPFMSCEIYDSAGKSSPPLLVVRHPSRAGRSDESLGSKRKRSIAASVLLVLAVFLFWVDWRSEWMSVLWIVVSINFVFAALRLLLLNVWIGDTERTRERRLNAHLGLERRESPADDVCQSVETSTPDRTVAAGGIGDGHPPRDAPGADRARRRR